MNWRRFSVIVIPVLLVLFTVLGCESDADKIRDINESLRSPTPTATRPSPTTKPPTTTQVIADTVTPSSTTPKQTETRQPRAIATTPTATPTPISTTPEPADSRQPRAITTTPTATPTKPLQATIDALDLQQGDCIVSSLPDKEDITIETVVIVPCNEEWQYRVLNTFEIQDSNYPSDIEFEQHAYSNCDRHYSYTLIPTREGWESAIWRDRKVTCLQESFGLSLTDPGKLDRLVGWDSLQTGECFNEAPETNDLQVELVPCDSDWQLRLLNSFNVSGSNYPSDIEFEQYTYSNCDRRYTYTFLPTDDAWATGLSHHRKVHCLQESFGLSVSDPGKLDRLVSWTSLQSGECFNDALETDDLQVELVPCAGEWQYRVLNSFAVGGSILPSEMELDRQAFAECDPRYTLTLFPQESWPDWHVTCLQESFGLSLTDSEKLDHLVSLVSLEAGQCFREAPETMDLQVEMVDCQRDWDYQVVNVISVTPGSEYPGNSYFDGRAELDCHASSDTYFSPTAETWAIGDHQILCTKTN